MSRKLTPSSTLENLRREAKRWLKALRAHDAAARTRLERGWPEAPHEPTLRDVQHALAREHGLSGWNALRLAVAELAAQHRGDGREQAVEQLLLAAAAGDATRVAALLDRHPDIVNERAVIPGHTGLRTALHHAVSHEPVVRLLLERGADPNIFAGASVNVRDNTTTSVDGTEGYTPLHAAAFRGNAEAAAVLLAHGANPNVRESKYGSTPAGWAAYFGHHELRDLILRAEIDPFQAIDFDLPDRIPQIVQQSPWSLNRRFKEYVTFETSAERGDPEPWHTPLVWAVLTNKVEAVRALLEQGAAQTVAPDGRTLVQLAVDAGHDDIAGLLRENQRIDQTHEGRVRWFVKHACPDHDIRGPWHHAMAVHTAERMLRYHPEIAHDSCYTSIICGDYGAVERALAERPELARQRGGPKRWEPLLYLCFTRLPFLPAAADNAVALARLLLDHGADPNAYFMAGGSRYTPFVGVVGEGEEDRPPHPQRAAIAQLLLERGAHPFDIQVAYNIHFHGNVLWFLELIYEQSVRQGRLAVWQDPDWHMLDMGGYGTGARYFLQIALDHDDLALATWVLEHGASPHAAPAKAPRMPKVSLHEIALRRGQTAMAELLVRYGATPMTSAVVEVDPEAAFVAASLRLDRDEVQRLVREQPQLLQSPKAIIKAAEQNRADVVELLLDVGVPIEIENKSRQRPLHAAAWSDAIDVAQLLIERGADIEPVETDFNNTPLDFAVYSHHPRMMELLSRHSRELWNITFVGNVERVRELLRETPARARRESKKDETPLMWLPDNEDAAVELVQLYLEHGVDPNVRDNNGLTAADHASRRGLRDAAELLRARDTAARVS